MATGLLAKKIGMTQIYDETGKLFPVSVLRAGPCVVSQVKTVEKDGYAAVQIGFDALREKLLSKGEIGHFKKAGIAPQRILAEFRDMEGQSGQEINVSVFNAGDTVRVTGISKGKGFQGSMKRHGFGGGPA
ncbi:MAG TPA: 50S ribosomal protein L3, partial [Leptospiraceae bacterium]|nr:50S ribosomal protein L3 [Leptospiraceae bacterium]